MLVGYNYLGVSCPGWTTLVRGGHRQLVLIPDLAVQHYTRLDDPGVLLVDGEGTVVVPVRDLVVQPLVLYTVPVNGHHLSDEGTLVIALPGPGKVDGLREAGLVVVDVLDGYSDHGVGVQFVLTGRLPDHR